MKKIGVVLLALVGVVVFTSGCASSSLERSIKDAQSEYGGGLSRVVTVYDQNGKPIRQYDGKIDIATDDTQQGDKVKFDLNGKRIIIYNATVIAEEK